MSRKNILIVDDEESLLNVYEELLVREGYMVVTASTSKEALEKVKKTRFHLAVLDIVLPDIQGDMLAREIKKMDEAIQIIFVTGYPEFQSCIESLDVGVAEILLKPLTKSELLTATENALLTSEKRTPRIQTSSSKILSRLLQGYTLFMGINHSLRNVSSSLG
jgi:DNA-binding NtrC family response regulator